MWYLLLQCILISMLVFTVTVYAHKFAIWYLLLQCILISLLVFTVTVYPHKFAIWYLLLQCILISLLYGIYCYSVSSYVCYMVFTVTV